MFGAMAVCGQIADICNRFCKARREGATLREAIHSANAFGTGFVGKDR